MRHIRYDRSDVGLVLDLITRHAYSTRGYLDTVVDPRLFDASVSSLSGIANFRYGRSLSGQAIAIDSADAGRVQHLLSAASRLVVSIDGAGRRMRNSYDSLDRLVTVGEETALTRCIRERIDYGSASEDAGSNRRGRAARHFDPAGLHQTLAYDLFGRPRTQSRRLLPGVDMDCDWTVESVASAATLSNFLSDVEYQTRWWLDATGAVIAREDAKNNLQMSRFDLCGRLRRVELRLRGQRQCRLVLDHRQYLPGGQILDETAGNGVVTHHQYDPCTQRPIRLWSTRPRHTDRKTLIRDSRYQYDPVGNIVSIEDLAQSVAHFANQRVEARQRYKYDALYQLIEATGVEDANAGEQTDAPLPRISADGRRVPYTRRYQYDRGGNLIRIAHHGNAGNYTRNMFVSETSNRSAADNLARTRASADIDACFDANGNAMMLRPAMTMQWDGRNRLREVVLLARDASANDRELYRYDSQHQRISKTTLRNGKSLQCDTVHYLPGLELRSRAVGGRVNETTHVIVFDLAGYCRARLVRWEIGQPAAIENNYLRFSLDDQIGSSVIELDASADFIGTESFFPYGGTALRASRSEIETKYKYVRYSGKERDTTGLYYYGWRYYLPWTGRWASPDPTGPTDGLNLFRMARNNPIVFLDSDGRESKKGYLYLPFAETSIYEMAVGYNVVRALNDKDPYEIIAGNRAIRNAFASHLRIYNTKTMPLKTGKSSPPLMIAKWTAALGRLATTQSRPENQLSDWSDLDPTTSKIYVLGHGNAGLSMIAAGQQSKMVNGKLQKVTDLLEAKELADQFVQKQLSSAFVDFRLIACQGADAITATDFSGTTSVAQGGKKALGRHVADELIEAGFAAARVTAYHGYGLISDPVRYENRFKHQQRSLRLGSGLTGPTCRNREARQVFTRQ